jgi:hypothetical protein
MHPVLKDFVKWGSLPVLAIAAMFSRFASGYELLVDLAVCLCAIILIQRASWLREYYFAAGLAAVAIVFSPVILFVKIFILMGLTCVAMSVSLFRSHRLQPVTLRQP